MTQTEERVFFHQQQMVAPLFPGTLQGEGSAQHQGTSTWPVPTAQQLTQEERFFSKDTIDVSLITILHPVALMINATDLYNLTEKMAVSCDEIKSGICWSP